MDKIIVEPRNKEELESISAFLKERKIKFLSEEDYEFEKQMEARRGLAKLAETFPKIDISEEEIINMVNEVRAQEYASKNKNNPRY